MANYDDDEIDDAILFQAEDGITYSPLDSPGSADPPTQQLLVLPDPGAGLASSTKPSPQEAVLATANATEGGPGFENGAKASGIARTTSHPLPHTIIWEMFVVKIFCGSSQPRKLNA